MIKLNIHFDGYNKTMLIGYNCPNCKQKVNSNIKFCSSCYKKLPKVLRLEWSIMERCIWHISPEDELTAAITEPICDTFQIYKPGSKSVQTLWWVDIDNIKSME